MFLQVIRGAVSDLDGLRAQLDVWRREHAPAAEGWLGTTSGVTDDGQAIAVVRFASADAARRNSDRPEQGRWWSETERHFDGPVEFIDCADAESFLGGGSDDAGFVQVIVGRTADVDRLAAVMREMEGPLHEQRPEVIGGSFGWDDQGRTVETVYFTSEAEAREGEARMQADELRAVNDEYLSLLADVRYFDLRDPWLWSPPV